MAGGEWVGLEKKKEISVAILVLEVYIKNSWLLKHLAWFNEFIWLSEMANKKT